MQSASAYQKKAKLWLNKHRLVRDTHTLWGRVIEGVKVNKFERGKELEESFQAENSTPSGNTFYLQSRAYDQYGYTATFSRNDSGLRVTDDTGDISERDHTPPPSYRSRSSSTTSLGSTMSSSSGSTMRSQLGDVPNDRRNHSGIADFYYMIEAIEAANQAQRMRQSCEPRVTPWNYHPSTPPSNLRREFDPWMPVSIGDSPFGRRY